ncbi:hypothetical protein Sm713_01190 [Streptomyces sp. TS71-3]|nr:hypothetical protein Sm713_01190 [Streptomyces sp. TS71-3]
MVEARRDLVQALGAGHGQLGVAARRESQVGDHVLAHPQLRHPLTHRLDGAGHLAPRDGRQHRRRPGHRPRRSRTQGGIQQMHTGRADGDPDLPRPRTRRLHRLVPKIPRRTEGVQSDSAHDKLPVLRPKRTTHPHAA